jgi:hypothetical protein
MDINIQWVTQVGTAVTDYFNVLYKEFDLYPPLNGLNNWILATDPPLPPTQFNYTITGLKENTIYRIMVTKSCTGLTEIVDEITFIRTGYPVIGTWQGPIVNNYPTLFYSVYYPEGNHIANALVKLYDTETYDRMLMECGAPDPAYVVVGRNGYLTGAICPPVGNSWNYLCDLQTLDYLLPSNTSSAVSYYGRDSSTPLFPLCDGTASMPLLLKYNNDYKLYSKAIQRFATTFSSIDPTSAESAVNWPAFTFPSDPTQPYPNLNSANINNISSAVCFDPLTATANYTFADGTGRTNINNYLFSFTTSDGINTIPYVNNSGLPITSYNGNYTIYAPIKIESVAPGGGNPLGYTITGASVAGGSTTYTYSGGTNAFTIGQNVFVNNVNPVAFNFSSLSKTITAATANTFTVSYNPAGTYQTGGNASGYTEITNNMTITVDLLPGPINVITLTNQNYAGLTLVQALNQVAGAINVAGTYTASAVVIAGLPYLRINMPNTSYGLASIVFEGPNILAKGTPDIYQISSPGGSNYSSLSSFNYNGFLYSSFYEAGSASIVASDINNPTSATNYSHPIDVPVWEMTLVPEIPPTTVYSLDHVVSGGEYSLNIAIDTTTGYSYTANNTTVSVYDGTTFIDSQDLSLLPLGPTTPIRLMEFNTVDNLLFVFVDGSSNNFHIVDVAPWNIDYTGTYGQTNYLTTSSITAWNNLTSGPTAALGTVTSAPTVPIPCTGVNSIPCLPVPGIPWQFGANDGTKSALFQDTTKSWSTPPATTLYPNTLFYVYNYANENLGFMVGYNGTTYYPSYGVSSDIVRISAGVSPTSYTAIPFSISNGDNYGIFSRSKISDYTANFNSRTWSNLSRYLLQSTSGRNNGANGFLNTNALNHTATTFNVDSYGRGLAPKDKQINTTLGLDGTTNYTLFDITDGGTCYNPNTSLVYISLDGGVVETIDSTGLLNSYQLYKDFPLNAVGFEVEVSLQLVASTDTDKVYAIARDARSDVDDMNIYVLDGTGQIDVIEGSTRWNIPICGQIGIDSVTEIVYFTGKHTRNFYEFNPATGFWDNKIIPSLYEKVDGYTYGTASPLSRVQGIVERIQGASYIGGGKFVVMNYMQQAFSTELKYVYDVANLFVYDYTNNTIEQALIGTGVNTYSGAAASYNLNYYGENFGVNDYNNDYCYGGLGIKVDSNTGSIYWKKSISDQVYFSEANVETGIAQIWACSNVLGPCSRTIRIWNIQNDGSLIPSKRTIFDAYSSFSNLVYDSWYQKVMTFAPGSVGGAFQFYAINPKNLAGCHGVDDIGYPNNKYNNGGTNIAGLSISTYLSGKSTYVYAVDIDLVSPGTITYSVRPTNASFAYNGIFPHHYAVGEVVRISGILSSPVDELNFPNSNTSSTTYATILSITAISFTVANITGTSATYTSGGTVTDAVWASVYSAGNFAAINTDGKGSVIITGSGNGAGLPGYSNAGSTFILKYGPNDILTQRENPSVTAIGLTSTICSASPDGLFRGIGNINTSINRVYGQLNNAFSIHIPTQNAYWVMGTKNPSCTVTNITNAIYNAGTVRYFINNNFLVGKNVDITGITPSTYNLSNVTITAVDPINIPQQWFDISYTGTAPATFIPPTPPTITGTVVLTPNFVIKVLDDATLATIATIDLSFINTLLVGWTNPDAWSGRFQYSPAKEEIYLYGDNPALPIYTFSTITNTLVKSSSFNRMVTPYSSLTTIFGTEDVNGIPYYSAYTATDIPTRRWFRLDLGSRNYLNVAHGQFDAKVTDAVTNYTFNYDFYSSYVSSGDTFGQWKDILGTTWDTIPATITTTLNSTIEFVSFKINSPIMLIVNNTTGYIYPVSNTLNYVPVYSILIDNVNISNADALNFTFANPDNPSCPFIHQVTIYF